MKVFKLITTIVLLIHGVMAFAQTETPGIVPAITPALIPSAQKNNPNATVQPAKNNSKTPSVSKPASASQWVIFVDENIENNQSREMVSKNKEGVKEETSTEEAHRVEKLPIEKNTSKPVSVKLVQPSSNFVQIIN